MPSTQRQQGRRHLKHGAVVNGAPITRAIGGPRWNVAILIDGDARMMRFSRFAIFQMNEVAAQRDLFCRTRAMIENH